MTAGTGSAPLGATVSFSTLGCGELELEDVLALAARRGIAAVELRTLGERNALPAYFEARYGTPDRLRHAVAAFAMRIVSLDSSCNAIGATAGDRAELTALAPWAAAVGAPAIRVFDGGERGDAAELGSMRPLFDWWSECGAGPELIVETHDALARHESLVDFITRFPGVGVLWDTHHTWREGGVSPAVTWAVLRGRTHHLHVKDSGPTGAYVVPGTGGFPFDDLFGALRASGYAGVISLEWERHWYPELAPIDDALDGFAEVLSRETRLP